MFKEAVLAGSITLGTISGGFAVDDHLEYQGIRSRFDALARPEQSTSSLIVPMQQAEQDRNTSCALAGGLYLIALLAYLSRNYQRPVRLSLPDPNRQYF